MSLTSDVIQAVGRNKLASFVLISSAYIIVRSLTNENLSEQGFSSGTAPAAISNFATAAYVKLGGIHDDTIRACEEQGFGHETMQDRKKREIAHTYARRTNRLTEFHCAAYRYGVE